MPKGLNLFRLQCRYYLPHRRFDYRHHFRIQRRHYIPHRRFDYRHHFRIHRRHYIPHRRFDYYLRHPQNLHILPPPDKLHL